VNELIANIADGLAIVFVVIGVFFMLVGALGIVRLPDCYHRLHAASKCGTLGLLGLLLGAFCHLATTDIILTGALAVAFAFIALPTGSHILAKAAHRDGASQWHGTLSDDLAEDDPPLA
jgi:multicomponent Na+:H+ antiporter subunit G